ncbi:helix-turn-helix domain-containing protein [Ruegeria halocynthiae]|uniref:helix-turn-helix domain-containing protein n=1 Tax=Ruegeria halocynthiae TaxID=985054 RepID=UPI000691E2E1|nr:helix-turn-helix domain-containing protein [Ruegeria halocynthiae]
MRHYVLNDGHARQARPAAKTPERTQHIDVIFADPAARASAEMVVEFYNALNDLVEDHTYTINLRMPGEEPAGGPLYWAGRTAIFWGDIHNNWQFAGPEKSWASQVLNLSSRTILVGGAVLLLAQYGRAEKTVAAIHPNFATAAREKGIIAGGTSTHFETDGRTHSASSRLSALRLLSEFVSLDHGEHLADTLRSYIGLSEPKPKCESRLAVRLIHRSGADPLVCQAIQAMLDHIEDPLRISDLATALRTSTRQLQRRFLSKTGAKLLATYTELRLERAHGLLRYTDLAQREIATATGFSSVTAMGRSFRTRYKATPEAVRHQRYSGELSAQVS